MRSYKAIQRIRDIIINTPKEPAGISKYGVMCRSMEAAWSTGKEVWLRFTDIMIPVDHNGITLISDFSSSTSLTVQRLHGSKALPSGVRSCRGFLIMHALFRNLDSQLSQCTVR